MKTDCCSIIKIILTSLALLWQLLGNLRPVWAQTDTIRLNDKRLMTQVLQPGNKQYLVYFQNVKSKKNLRFWFWLRNIEVGTKNNEKVLP